MSESILNALMQLFALAESMNLKGFSAKGRAIASSFLEQHIGISRAEEFLKLYDNYLDFYNRELSSGEDPAIFPLMTSRLCNRLSKELSQLERLIVFIRLMEFVLHDFTISEKEEEFLRSVSREFSISEEEKELLIAFSTEESEEKISRQKLLIISDQPEKSVEELEGSWIEQNKPGDRNESSGIYRKGLQGKIEILYLEGMRAFVLKHRGKASITLDQRPVLPDRLYVLENGTVIRSKHTEPVYFSDIVACFYQPGKIKIVLEGINVEYSFPGASHGIHSFSFREESGHLIGVIGGSGVGKSTLLKLLNGQLPLKSGNIFINGFDLHKDKFKLQGVIGYVPQDDLLFEDLTVFQNLYYNAKLCFGNQNDKEITEIVENIINDLDLADVKHMKVGTPLRNMISGGQRKRLNIALELMREPGILLVDEPTSGLSSMDAEKVMQLLREQANKGKLVIVNIHQPSSNIFKLLDRIWVLDRGGYPVYTGNPVDSLVYFKSLVFHANATESECPSCGNIDTEQILKILEARKIDDRGKPIRERRKQPEEWYHLYKEKIEKNLRHGEAKRLLPRPTSSIPGETKQFIIFSIRNLLSKISNKQYVLIALLEAPILAAILAWFTKYETHQGYLFSENKNLPQYLFMSVVVALFIGLTISAEEIIRDRKIILRESFLNLSRFSYVNSKVIYVFVLSALQTILFVLVGNTILGIKDMTLSYWLVLFSASCFANMLGLNLSSGMNSVISIYIAIPLILVPQLLFSGVIVSFDDLHKSLTRKTVVPVIGDLMASRWAYEALAVTQFRHNRFEKHFFEADQKLSEASFKTNYLLPRLETIARDLIRKQSDSLPVPEKKVNLALLHNELTSLQEFSGIYPFEYSDSLTETSFSESIGKELLEYLTYVKIQFFNKIAEANKRKDSIYEQLRTRFGEQGIYHLKTRHYNNRLAEVVMNRNEIVRYLEIDNRIVPKKDPIFFLPESDFGRAHFYAPVKRLNGQYIDTLWFNITVLWIMTFLLYAALLTDSLANCISWTERKRYRKK